MKRLVRVFFWVLAGVPALVVLLLACGSLFGGRVAGSYLNGHGKELVGRRVTVERVGLNFFTGSVRVAGLTVYEDDGVERFAGFDSLRVDVSLLRALGRRVQVRRLRLAGLEVEVRREGSGFNFTSIIEHFQQADTAADREQDTTGGGWVVSLHNVELVRGRLGYTDVQRGSRAGMNDLNLKVPDFTIGGSEGTDAGRWTARRTASTRRWASRALHWSSCALTWRKRCRWAALRDALRCGPRPRGSWTA